MNHPLFERRPRKDGSIVASIAIHALAIALLASVTFRVPLAAFLRTSRPVVEQPERVRYVRVQPAPPPRVGNGSAVNAPPRRTPPAQLLAPSTIPSTLPPIPPPNVSVGAISGKPGGSGGAAAGFATGVEPALPDPRLELDVSDRGFPKSPAQRADSAVRAAFEAYRQAVIAEQMNPKRDPRDWTIEKNGQKYGIDSQKVYLGKFSLPSAILAALPIWNTGGVDGSRVLAQRSSDWIRRDILEHSQGMSPDDFRAAVRRIRERKERERKDAEEAKAKGGVVP